MGMLWGSTVSRRGRRVAVELKRAEVDRAVSRYRETKVNESDGDGNSIYSLNLDIWKILFVNAKQLDIIDNKSIINCTICLDDKLYSSFSLNSAYDYSR